MILNIIELNIILLQHLLVCSPYYGMDIMTAWGLGYRGEGVTIGVVDTGIEVSHIDLAPNIVSPIEALGSATIK